VLRKFYKPQTNRKSLAEAEGISRVALYQWENTYLGKDFPLRMTSKKQGKTLLIDALRNQFNLKKLLQQLQLSKSSYFYQKQVLEQSDKYFEERQLIVTIFNSNFCAYGYRRIHQALKNMGKILSEKVVLKLMFEENLFVKFSRRKNTLRMLGRLLLHNPIY
jgi:hypothetical protein